MAGTLIKRYDPATQTIAYFLPNGMPFAPTEDQAAQAVGLPGAEAPATLPLDTAAAPDWRPVDTDPLAEQQAAFLEANPHPQAGKGRTPFDAISDALTMANSPLRGVRSPANPPAPAPPQPPVQPHPPAAKQAPGPVVRAGPPAPAPVAIPGGAGGAGGGPHGSVSWTFGAADAAIRADRAKIAADAEAARTAGENAARERATYEHELSGREATLLKAHDDAQDMALAHQKAKDAAFNQAFDKHMADLDQLSAEAASTQIDPAHFWATRSTGDMIVAALSGLLSVAAARPGVTNPWMTVIDNAIDKDIDAQKANLAQRNVAVSQKRGFLQELRSKYDTEAQQDAAVRVAAISKVESRLKEMVAGMGSQLAQVNAKEAFAKLAADKLAATEASAHLTLPPLVEAAKSKAEVGERYAALGQSGSPKRWQILSPMQQMQHGSTAAAIETITGLRDEFKTLGPLAWFQSKFPDTDATNYESRRNVVGAYLTRSISGAAMPEPQRVFLTNLLANTSAWDKTAAGKFDAILSTLESQNRHLLESAGEAGVNVSGFGSPKAPGGSHTPGSITTGK